MKLSYSTGAHGTIYIWNDDDEKILYVIENKSELKALLDILTELYNDIA